jgi:hypothetical protein
MLLAGLLVDHGRAAEALALSGQSLNIWTATSSASNPAIAQAHAIHAYALGMLGRTREAAEELAPAAQVLVSTRGLDDPSVRRAQNWLKNAHTEMPPTASAKR